MYFLGNQPRDGGGRIAAVEEREPGVRGGVPVRADDAQRGGPVAPGLDTAERSVPLHVSASLDDVGGEAQVDRIGLRPSEDTTAPVLTVQLAEHAVEHPDTRKSGR